MDNINWISENCLISHIEKHIKQCDLEKDNWEAKEWNRLYSSSPYFENRIYLIKNKNEGRLREIYEKESKKVHRYKSKIHLYYDDKAEEFKANISRNKDKLVIGEIIEDDQFKINTCFFKKNEYIDSEILTLLIKLDAELQKNPITKYQEIFQTIKLLNDGVYIYKNSELIGTYSHIIVGILGLPHVDENDTTLYIRRYTAKKIFIAFLENQWKYKRKNPPYMYNYIIKYFSAKNTIQEGEHSKAKEVALKNLTNIIKVHNWSKSYDEYIEYIEMSVIFNLICFYISCKELACIKEYNKKYNEIDEKIFKQIPNRTQNYDIITNLILDNFEE